MVLVLLIWTFELMPVPEKLATFEAFDNLTHEPNTFYLILEKIRGHDMEYMHVEEDFWTLHFIHDARVASTPTSHCTAKCLFPLHSISWVPSCDVLQYPFR